MCEIIVLTITGLGSYVTTNEISLSDSCRNMVADWVMLGEVKGPQGADFSILGLTAEHLFLS